MRLTERRWSWVVMLRYDPRELERARMTTLECGSCVAGMSSLSQRNTPLRGIHFVQWRHRVFCRASSHRCHWPSGCPATSSCWPPLPRFCTAGGCGSPRSRASAAPTAPMGSSCFSSCSSSPPPSPSCITLMPMKGEILVGPMEKTLKPGVFLKSALIETIFLPS